MDAGAVAGGELDAGQAAGARPDAEPPDSGTDGGRIDPCVGRADGVACGEGSTVPLVCVGGTCQVSVCGDRVVDPRTGEQCDDGNDVPADGCEPISCVRSCATADDCDDGNVCNGVESCEGSVCVRGTPPFNPACTTSTGAEGSCDGDFCVPEGCGNGRIDEGEECDDENSTTGDGCEPDCTLSCHEDSDCQDGDRCNGEELCSASEGCVRRPAPACNATDACEAAMCDPRTGCRVVRIDADGDGHAPSALGACGRDCDDTDPAIHEGATERCNAIDDDCDGVIDEDVGTVSCHPDTDGDGFGDPALATEECLCPAGTVTTARDCYDAPNPVGAAVNPMQEAFYRLPYCRGPSSTSCSFDYDCDGNEERQSEAVHTRCSVLTLLTRCTGQGWEGGVPACGAEGTWVECDGLLGGLGLICTPRRTTRVQTCR